MEKKLQVFNTLTRKKEIFEPLHPGLVGMYVCGPTVYGDPHLGHARSALTFDLVFRYLKYLGYKVRYVRNITDVGHLENDADQGEDKIAKKARLEQLEPMEVAQYYTDRYHDAMDLLHVLRPSIESRASGHILEQIDLVQTILDEGFAYVVNGSVYFDINKYNQQYHYGKLSGRVLEDLMSTTRTNLEGQDEKRNPADFALWKKAQPEHIMRWKSPWSDGFPGWHLECSAMARKYLGEQFDIHGGGMDLLFPHHESEIAQSQVAYHTEPAKYWLHNNMITINNGQKMGKSLKNSITLDQFFSGDHPALERAYSPMCIRFFVLQAHYRSTVDFSNDALQAAEKGLKKLQQAIKTLNKLQASASSTAKVDEILANCEAAMNDDFNSPMVIAQLFEATRLINATNDKKEQLTAEDIQKLKQLFDVFFKEILGLTEEAEGNQGQTLDAVMQLLLTIRQQAKDNKDYATSDQIRNELTKINIAVKDGKDGASWSLDAE